MKQLSLKATGFDQQRSSTECILYKDVPVYKHTNKIVDTDIYTYTWHSSLTNVSQNILTE
jgi:hypothetical protein